MHLLEVEGLVARYGRITALDGISLHVDEGEIVTLIGANGAGKSTTLRAISGLLRPSAGSVRFAGREIAGRPADAIVRLGIGHAPEGRRVFARMTVRENLELGAFTRTSRREIAADTERVLTIFPRLAERLDQKAGTMSGGEQQMLAIGRALMGRPQLLLLDEPSLGLAPLLVQTIFAVMREINAQGTTLLLIEQNARQALALAGRGYVLEVGRIAHADTGANLMASPAVQAAYLGGASRDRGAARLGRSPLLRKKIVSGGRSFRRHVQRGWTHADSRASRHHRHRRRCPGLHAEGGVAPCAIDDRRGAHRGGEFSRRGQHGRRDRQCQGARLDDHYQRRHRREGALQLPGLALGTGDVRPLDPRGRLRARRARAGDGRRAEDRERRLAAA